MPLFKKRVAAPAFTPSAPAAIVAAATRLRPDRYGNIRIPKSAMTEELWRQFEISGELAFAATWLGNALSRCHLYAAEVDKTGKILGASKDEIPNDLVTSFMGGPTGAAEALKTLGVHMTVPGDSYVVARVQQDGSLGQWEIVSTDEIRPGLRGQIIIDRGNGDVETLDENMTLVTRVYRPHPRKKSEAWSPAMAALPVLRETEQLLKYKFAIMDSRLAGSGILFLPSELDFPNPEGEVEDGASPFLTLLTEVMMASLKDRGKASSIVPIVVQGPAEAIAAAKWMVSPHMDLIAQASADIVAAIHRLALALDMPPEVLTGVSGANDWNGYLIAEEAVKLHIEPVMALICAALTEGYLIPALEAAGLDSSKYVIWFDPSELVLRPNQGVDAKDAYDRGELSGEALLRYLGFTSLDAPTGNEKAKADIIALLKAAPQLGDAMAIPLFKVMDLQKYGITEDDIRALAPDPAGGTPPITDPDELDPSVNEPAPDGEPISGRRGNKGPANPRG